MTSCIFHNLLIEEPFPEDWFVEDVKDILDDNNKLNVLADGLNSNKRHMILFYCFFLIGLKCKGDLIMFLLLYLTLRQWQNGINIFL